MESSARRRPPFIRCCAGECRPPSAGGVPEPRPPFEDGRISPPRAVGGVEEKVPPNPDGAAECPALKAGGRKEGPTGGPDENGGIAGSAREREPEGAPPRGGWAPEKGARDDGEPENVKLLRRSDSMKRLCLSSVITSLSVAGGCVREAKNLPAIG
jgi:hypothetical protein